MVHEPARQAQNYKNMRKVFNSNAVGDSGGAPFDPFEEDDIGRRFELLKDQMMREGLPSNENSGLVLP